jgi:hypothetical protein
MEKPAMSAAKAATMHKERPPRKVLSAEDLSSNEMDFIRASKVKTDEPYKLADLDENGGLKNKSGRNA